MFFKLLRLVLMFALVVSAPLSFDASAQGLGQAPAGLVADQQKILQDLTTKTDNFDKKIQQDGDDDATLVDIRLQLEELSRQSLNSALAFRTRLSEINSRLEQLGPAPAAGQPPEPDIVSTERQALVSEKAEINAVIAQAQTLSIRISGMIDKIGNMRSALFRNLLTKRYVLSDALSPQVFSDARDEFGNFYKAVSSWLSFAFRFKFQAILAATFVALGLALVLLVGGRRLFGRVFEADPSNEDPSYLSRLSVAFWSTLLPTLAVGAFLGSTIFFFNYYNVLRGDIGLFLNALATVIGVVFCVNRLANAALEPRLPNWRLIPVESGPARWLVRLTTAMAVVISVNTFLSVINDKMGSPLSLTIARSFVATIVVGIILILMAMLRPFKARDGSWRPWPAWLRYLALALGLFTIIAALLGYIGLALFVSLQVVVTGTALVTAYIGFLSAQAIGDEGAFANTSVGRWLSANSSYEDTALDQLGLVVSVAINVMIVLVFLPLILLMWGFQPGDIQAWAYKLATGINIGSVTISVTGILSGIVVFIIGYFLTRWFQGWLDGSVMARGKVDTGVRNSIRLAVGYAGVALAALIGISAAGIDLSSLALVAGALSLGIGFGLQNVVSNFVSGLILLAERPFKVGDWIVAGDISGTVKKISVRATEIETFQRQSVILPNSNLINNAVGNWTHRNKLGRIDIKVGVAYGSDVKQVHAVLLEIARGHPLVLKNPEPFVLFSNFGPAALEFEIRLFLADVMNGNIVQNDIRFTVLETFSDQHIEIPSTPRAVVEPKHAKAWPTDDDKIEADFAEQERAKAEAAAEAKRLARSGRKAKKPDPD
ncbi:MULTISPECIES: mechanosensitive ion channel family protein [unclassified Mesorhizobium]|uniref:mechanosensitive ion channel family protein n=1 Tax=unclassified Mesorhizobium TaxID=325217 RepID=UPI00112EF970|nr:MULTISPECIES: mechanosensitive ion channel family protein [unclassified Mesorhizobium]TPI52340.1 mechanosensitive ion channel family protein [Mesorhizobium sp. B3-1-1]TPJ66077.1 mechanosensitive ion channel family protein [Mesorhizobium sp. B2-6-7]TPJ84957.1 mechanosensitive ion channel family protein [Mesorhizobium sp. B2-6-3]TPJ99306.1 mechanosensitive ion channel family protein [Mesorhizobium sp. B2-5-10]TPK10866.1 mechanosensitive ion channel family protein [Mesorhizobium sp. B2-5-11]